MRSLDIQPLKGRVSVNFSPQAGVLGEQGHTACIADHQELIKRSVNGCGYFIVSAQYYQS